MKRGEQLVRTVEDMDTEAQAFVDALTPEQHSATLITLLGDLGAGKTAFVQATAAVLGVEGPITSPTFVIAKVYLLPEGQHFDRLIHIDAYRLNSLKDLNAIGFGEMASNTKNLIMLEWPEQVEGILENSSLNIMIEALDDGARQITYA
ncbi:tRNA (adenosine(37)-N6)-threonylcarbamoyltransferase complex ATPase subunit type 1 TsaE [Patescibacteria group bacterium]|nr:tRNA (adenosine(37)-N6)-threonylcarbamoyltransferase complex ATPase subunit type 1 TsaE [Patescibacteria group bacterium]